MRGGRGTDRQGQTQGFTLVEVLVVSVIVGILAAVAIPMYSGYIKNQRRQAATAVAQTAAVSASSLYRRTGVYPNGSQIRDAISLPNPAQFDVDTLIIGTDHYVAVGEKSSSDTAMGLAKF